MTLNRQYKITPVALKKMKEHLMGAYPLEGCGILVGDEGGSIEEVFGTKNAVTASTTRIPRRSLEKIRLVLAFLKESPMESEAVLSVVIFELARLGRLTLLSCFNVLTSKHTHT